MAYALTEQNDSARLAQLNASRKHLKTHVGGLKGRFLGKAIEKLGEEIAERMIQAVENKNLTAWPIVYALAIFTDFIDIIVSFLDLVTLGLASLIQTPLKLFCMIILWRFSSSFKATGPLLGTRIKLLYRLGSWIELLPLIKILPTWTLGTMWLQHKINERADLAEKGLEQAKKGKVPHEILQHFIHG